MSNSLPRTLVRAGPWLLLALSACSHEAPDLRASSEPAAKATVFSAAAATSAQRSNEPRVVALRQALEEGRVEVARAELRLLAGELGVERLLLEARLAAVLQDDVRVSQLIEQARAEAPQDARVYATSAELHAASGRLETSQAEVLRGASLCGMTPELERARGVQLICTSGAAEAGLRLLEAAQEHDAQLPFLHRPLCQAYRLVGQRRLGMGELPEAYRHARLALENGPEDLDARRFMAECLVGLEDHAAAARIYAELVEAGQPLQQELRSCYKNAGVAALLQQDRAAAVKQFLAAREAGMSEEELATGHSVLESEAQRRIEQARERYDAGELEQAEALAQEALRLDPDCHAAHEELASYATLAGLAALREQSFELARERFVKALAQDPRSLEAHNFLGHTLIELGKPAEAAQAWSWVVDTARLEHLELPEPVHLLLANAHSLSGDVAESRATLEEYLALEPDGQYAAQTRKVLALLPTQDEAGER